MRNSKIMDKKKIISYLGFAQKAGKIIYGADNVLKKKKLYPLVIICSSASDRTKKDIASFCGNAPLVEVEDLSSLMNKNGVKVVAVTDFNLSEAIVNECNK